MPPITRAWDANSAALFAEMIDEVKNGIVEVITAELIPAIVTSGEKVPKVKNRRIVDLNPGTWAGRLKSPRHLEIPGDDDSQKVHCYMVGYGGIVSANDDNTTGGKSFQVRFLVDSYYEDQIGTDADNAEIRHSAEIHRITHRLWMSRTLRRPGIVKKIVDWSERRGFAKMGDTITRESLAELIVDLDAVPMIPPI